MRYVPEELKTQELVEVAFKRSNGYILNLIPQHLRSQYYSRIYKIDYENIHSLPEEYQTEKMWRHIVLSNPEMITSMPTHRFDHLEDLWQWAILRNYHLSVHVPDNMKSTLTRLMLEQYRTKIELVKEKFQQIKT